MDLDEDVGPKLNSTTLDSNSTWSVGYDARHIHIADGPEQGENGVTIGSKNDSANLPIRRRAPIACRRCRRMRSKCVHEKTKPPCKACEEAGLGPADCEFPVRGQPDHDRQYRRPRTRADKTAKRDPNKVRRDVSDAPIARQSSTAPAWLDIDEWDLLPPLPEVVDAVCLFTRKYFQLGFIPKELFPQRLRQNHRSVSVFLLLSILSISARFSPALAKRYEGEISAAHYFMEHASNLALRELYREPTLERCQAFYLLSIAQQGSGHRNRSYINLGVATRLAVLMHLHREEAYTLSSNPTKEEIIKAESARRTLWMLHSQDNLHCGAKSPTSLAANDITCLLPCSEGEFSEGRQPLSRAALEDTPPARDNEGLIHQPDRSLFATLIQAHYYWGKVARGATVSSKSPAPWEDSSDFAVMARKLEVWEKRLPAAHRWSYALLQEYKAAGEDLAYMNVTMMTKLCNIVLRRPYLDEVIHPNIEDATRRSFFAKMSDDLFRNVRDLYEQIDAHFAAHGKDRSVGAQIASFCVYSCGLLSKYLCKYKEICSDVSIVREGPNMFQRCMSILIDSKRVWPLASRWLESLEQFSRDPKAAVMGFERGMTEGDDRVPRLIRPIHSPSFSRDSAKPLLTSDSAVLVYGSQSSLRRSSYAGSDSSSNLRSTSPYTHPFSSDSAVTISKSNGQQQTTLSTTMLAEHHRHSLHPGAISLPQPRQDLRGSTPPLSTIQPLTALQQEQVYFSAQTSQQPQQSYPLQMFPAPQETCAQLQAFPIFSRPLQATFDQSSQQPRTSQQTMQTLQAFPPHPTLFPITHAPNPNPISPPESQHQSHSLDVAHGYWGALPTPTVPTLHPGSDGFETELGIFSGNSTKKDNMATHGAGVASF